MQEWHSKPDTSYPKWNFGLINFYNKDGKYPKLEFDDVVKSNISNTFLESQMLCLSTKGNCSVVDCLSNEFVACADESVKISS